MRWLIVALLVTSGCGSPCQPVKATRCNGSVVEACGSNKKWQRVMDCAQVKAPKAGVPTEWICGETTTGCTCVPKGGK